MLKIWDNMANYREDTLNQCQVGDEIYFEWTSSNKKILGEIKEIKKDAYGIFVEVEGIKVENSDIKTWRFHTSAGQAYNLQRVEKGQFKLF